MCSMNFLICHCLSFRMLGTIFANMGSVQSPVKLILVEKDGYSVFLYNNGIFCVHFLLFAEHIFTKTDREIDALL